MSAQSLVVKLDLGDIAQKVLEILNERYARVAEEELLDAEITDADTTSLASPSLDDV